MSEALAKAVRDLRAITPQLPKGCTEDEMAAGEREVGFTLPSAYRAVMRCDGHGGLEALRGTSWEWHFFVENQLGAVDLLRENGAALPMPRFLVLAMHQGYQFFYCSLDADDPPVFHYLEGSPVPTEPFKPSITAFVCWAIELTIHELPGAPRSG